MDILRCDWARCQTAKYIHDKRYSPNKTNIISNDSC